MTYRTKPEIARQLLSLRQQVGLTQRQLAEAMQVDASVMSRIEAGQRALAIDELARAADYLGVSVDQLLREESPPFESQADSGDADTEGAIARMRRVIGDCESFCDFSRAR